MIPYHLGWVDGIIQNAQTISWNWRAPQALILAWPVVSLSIRLGGAVTWMEPCIHCIEYPNLGKFQWSSDHWPSGHFPFDHENVSNRDGLFSGSYWSLLYLFTYVFILQLLSLSHMQLARILNRKQQKDYFDSRTDFSSQFSWDLPLAMFVIFLCPWCIKNNHGLNPGMVSVLPMIFPSNSWKIWWKLSSPL